MAPAAAAGAKGGDGAVLRGPRTPFWSCNCGQDANWANRVACRGCGKAPPRTIVDKARAADRAAAQAARDGPRQPAARPGAAAESAQAAKDRKRIQELEKQVAALARERGAGEGAPADAAAAMDVDAGDGDSDGVSIEDLEKVLRDSERLLKSDHPVVQRLREDLDARKAKRWGSKKASARLRATEAKIERARKAVETHKAEAAAAEAALAAAQRAMQESLETVKRHEEELVVIQAELASQPGAGAAALFGLTGLPPQLLANAEAKAALELLQTQLHAQVMAIANRFAPPAPAPAAAAAAAPEGRAPGPVGAADGAAGAAGGAPPPAGGGGAEPPQASEPTPEDLEAEWQEFHGSVADVLPADVVAASKEKWKEVRRRRRPTPYGVL